MASAQSLLKGPSTSYGSIKNVTANSAIKILASIGNYYWISSGSVLGFVPKSSVAILLYQTAEKRTDDTEDLLYHDLTASELRATPYISNSIVDNTENENLTRLKNLAFYASTLSNDGDGFQFVSLDMIDYFQGHVSDRKSEYSNPLLSAKAAAYLNRESDGIQKRTVDNFALAIKAANGDPLKLAFSISNNPFYKTMNGESGGKKVPRPIFGNPNNLDFAGGLSFTMHNTNGFEIYLQNYSTSGNRYSASLVLVVHDVFGINQEDLNFWKASAGVDSWYVLQHYKNAPYKFKYQPYVSIIEYSVPISGTF